MTTKNITAYIFILLIIYLAFPLASIVLQHNSLQLRPDVNKELPSQNFIKINSITSHPPISIMSDAELISFPNQTGGDGGSWINACVIENLVIDTKGIGSPIDIHYTTAFLIIRNCTFTNSGTRNDIPGGEDAGISILDCKNIRIINCTFIDNFNGIATLNSENIFIINNSFSNNFWGMFISESRYCNISYNYVTECGSYGIGVKYSSRNNTVTRNVVSQCGLEIIKNGIEIWDANWNIISYNNVSYASDCGIYVMYGTGNKIFKNRLINNNNGCIGGDLAENEVYDNCCETSIDILLILFLLIGISSTALILSLLARNVEKKQMSETKTA